MKSPLPHIANHKTLVLFDGHCNLCNAAVQFILKRDRRERFLFAALSWPIGEAVRREYPELTGVDSILVYREGKVYAHSTAALHIAVRLGGLWPLMGVFFAVPRFLRDPVYRYIARNRYRWFGQKEQCMVPEPKWTKRFLKT